jgi:nitrite reductase/ring-hydroxylating ferredoxin subunit
LCTNLISVGRVEELPPGSKKLVETDLGNILVVNVEGQFFAMSNTCPHACGYLNYGLLEDYVIECPLHGWPFDVRSGQLLINETEPEDCLNTYPILVENGEVFIELPATTSPKVRF